MAYTGSKAQTGAGTTLSIGTTPTLVGEIINVKWSDRKYDTDEVTNMSSTVKEFISTIADPGTFSCDFNRVSTDAGQLALETAFASGAITPFTVQLPKADGQSTKGDAYAFNALVTELDYTFEPTKADKGSLKLKVSGVVTITPGS